MVYRCSFWGSLIHKGSVVFVSLGFCFFFATLGFVLRRLGVFDVQSLFGFRV